MSPSELNDFPDGLVTEMAEAGRAARALDAGADAPKPAFTMQLEGELRSGWSGTATEVAPHDRPASLWRLPSRLAAGRWVAVGLTASLVIAASIYGFGVLSPAQVQASATDAASAKLVRGGTASTLAPGMELRAGDEIKVAVGGRATLQLGGSYARLDGGADLQIAALDASRVSLVQTAGRVYHRVAVGSGGSYAVATANVTWTTPLAAFELDRHFAAGGADEVVGLALYQGVAVTGPSFDESLTEGSGTTVALATGGVTGRAPLMRPIDSAAMADSWLAGNVALDAKLSLPLGHFASSLLLLPTGLASVAPPQTPSARQTDIQVSPVPSQPPTATPAPTDPPTVRPAPTAPPAPTAVPPTAGPIVDLGTLGEADNLDHTFTFTWNAYTGGAFSGYVLVYETTASGNTPSYASGSPVWATPGPSDTSVNIPWPAPGSYQIRIQAIGVVDGQTVVLAQTSVGHARLSGSPSPSP